MLVKNYCHFRNVRRKRNMQSILLSISLMLALAFTPFVECSDSIEISPFFVDSSGNFSHPGHRYRRDGSADKLTPLVENMQRLARLTNGISLEIGLIDGSIPSDSVITEFLHMDPLKPKQITGLDSKIIDNALTELDNLHSQVKVSDEVTKVQDRLILLNNVREKSKFMGEFFELKNKQPYHDSLVQIQTKKDAMLLPRSLIDMLGAVKTVFFKLQAIPETMNQQKATDELYSFKVYVGDLRNMQTEVDNSATVLAALKELKSLKGASDFVELLDKEEQLRARLGGKVLNGKTDMSPVKQNFKTVFGAWSKLMPSQNSFETLDTLKVSRSDPKDFPRQLTQGLPRGKDDLDSLHSDCANSWIVDRIDNSSVVTASLKKALASFVEFTREFGNVEAKWKILEDAGKRQSVDSIMSLLKTLSTVNDRSAEITTLVDSYYKCESNGGFPSSSPKQMKLVTGNITALNTFIDSINDLSKINEMKNMSALISILEEGEGDGDKVKLLSDIVKKLKSHDQYKSISNVVRELSDYSSTHAAIIEKIPPIAKLITDNYPNLDEYHDDLKTARYKGFFECLEKIEDTGTLLKDSMNLVQKVQLPDQTFKDAKTTIKSILDSQSDLTHFQESAEKMKKVTTPESLALKPTFEKSKEHSQKLSNAVQGLAIIKAVLDKKKKTWDSFATEVDTLEKDPERDTWKTEDEAKIQELAKIKAELIKTLAAMDTFLKELEKIRRRRRRRAYRRPRSPKKFDFKELGTVFEAAAKIPDVKIVKDTLKEIKTVVSKVSAATSITINSALDELGKLNLEFSSYGFKDSVASLGAIDLFFTSYGTQMATVSQTQTPLPSGSQQQTPVPNAPAKVIVVTGAPVTDASFVSSPGFLALLIIIVLVLIVLAAVLLYFCVCRKKPKQQPYKPIDNWEDDLDKTQYGDAEVLALVGKTVHAISMLVSENGVLPEQYGMALLKNLDQLGKLHVDGTQKAANLSERRHVDFICKEATMPKLVGFDNPFIHANEMLIGTKYWIMSQGPQDGTEPEQRNPGKFKKDTREKHWAMIDQRNVTATAQVCNYIEKEQAKCSKYYSESLNGTVKCGRYTIKTIRKETNLPQFTDKKDFHLYTLEYTNSKEPTQPAKITQVLHYTKWPDQGCPVDPVPALEILKFLDQSEGNVLVHCSAGIGRTGTLVSIKYGIKLCQEELIEDVVDVIKPVRACRYGAVQTYDQVTYLVLCITKALMELRSVPYLKDYDAMYFYHEKIVGGGYEDGLPIDRVERQAELKKRLKEDKKNVEDHCKKKKEEYEKKKMKEKE